MTTPAGAAQAQPAAKGQGQAGQMPVPSWPFPVGVFSTDNVSDYQEAVTMTSGTVRFPDVRVEPDGWLRGIWFDVSATNSANTATVTINADAAGGTGAPFSAINQVLFRDTGGEQIFGPFGGYDWMNTNKFGGYHQIGDPRADLNYSVTTSSATNAGAMHFSLYLPLEVSSADSLGAVQNRSENSVYRVELTLEASTVVFGTAPSPNLPVFTIQTSQESFTEPVAALALSGRPVSQAPPSPGLLQYWKQEDDTVPGSSASYTLTNGIGYAYRNIHFKLIRSSGTRANGQADWPSPAEVTIGTQRIRNLYLNSWVDQVGRDFRLTAGNAAGVLNADQALGWENGVFPYPFIQDVSLVPGDEARRMYLRTKSGNTLKLRGTFGHAGTLYVNTNYLIPKDQNFAAIVA